MKLNYYDRTGADISSRDIYSNEGRGSGALNVLLVVFGSLAIIVVLVSLYRNLIGYDPISFTGLLNVLTNVPNVVVPAFAGFIQEDWGLFNFIRDFLNMFAGIVNFTGYLVTSFVQILITIGYFVSYTLGISIVR